MRRFVFNPLIHIHLPCWCEVKYKIEQYTEKNITRNHWHLLYRTNLSWFCFPIHEGWGVSEAQYLIQSLMGCRILVNVQVLSDYILNFIVLSLNTNYAGGSKSLWTLPIKAWLTLFLSIISFDFNTLVPANFFIALPIDVICLNFFGEVDPRCFFCLLSTFFYFGSKLMEHVSSWVKIILTKHSADNRSDAFWKYIQFRQLLFWSQHSGNTSCWNLT